MKQPRLAAWCILALILAGCANAPAPPAAALPSATHEAMAPPPSATDTAASSTPTAEQAQATDEQKPTITVNPRLHATNPENVKLASGDQPTLVEFFAFW